MVSGDYFLVSSSSLFLTQPILSFLLRLKDPALDPPSPLAFHFPPLIPSRFPVAVEQGSYFRKPLFLSFCLGEGHLLWVPVNS